MLGHLFLKAIYYLKSSFATRRTILTLSWVWCFDNRHWEGTQTCPVLIKRTILRSFCFVLSIRSNSDLSMTASNPHRPSAPIRTDGFRSGNPTVDQVTFQTQSNEGEFEAKKRLVQHSSI